MHLRKSRFSTFSTIFESVEPSFPQHAGFHLHTDVLLGFSENAPDLIFDGFMNTQVKMGILSNSQVEAYKPSRAT